MRPIKLRQGRAHHLFFCLHVYSLWLYHTAIETSLPKSNACQNANTYNLRKLIFQKIQVIATKKRTIQHHMHMKVSARLQPVFQIVKF